MSAPHLSVPPSDLADPELRGSYRVLGGPGTGKSGLLVDIAAAHLHSGAEPDSVLLLTGSARLSRRSRTELTTRLLKSRTAQPGGAVLREPLVRTVHSYAFAVLSRAAQRNDDAPPRLVTGSEQDGIIRELLAGDLADGAHCWPAALRPALATAGFATQLRDLLSRCAERGVDPVELQRIGRRSGCPEWVAAGKFAQQYEQVMLLRAAVGMAAPQATVPALGAAELVGVALEAFAVDPQLLAAERARIGVLLVDDAQHLDPQASTLVRVLAASVHLVVIAGDPNQSVFSFRGADPALLATQDAQAVTLTASHRCAPAVARAVSGVARKLPGANVVRQIDGAAGPAGALTARLAATAAAEATLITDALRRAHLVDGVPWSQMAVLVRSVPRSAGVLHRALAGACVPVDIASTTVPPVQQPAVRALLTVLTAAALQLDGEAATELLTGPIGRVDPVTLRQLRRALRRQHGSQAGFGALCVAALTAGPSNALPESLARPLRRVHSVLTAASVSIERGEDPRATLWQVWHRSGLQQRWLTAAQRGGPVGRQADRDLDAVTDLFDLADAFVSRTSGASVRGLVDHIEALQLPSPDREPLVARDAVTVTSVHAALGREWEFVVIAGLQEGLWPNTIPRGGVLATQHLVDIIDGVGAGTSTTAPLLAEERRLLVAALGRARSRVLVTAVDSADGDQAMLPSPFFAEVAQWQHGEQSDDLTAGPDSDPVRAPRLLAPAALVGRLRAVVCAPDGMVDTDVRQRAARELARLAAAGIPGAGPSDWQGLSPVSCTEPLWTGDDHVITVSPSVLQTLADCPLRWLLERHGGSVARDVRSLAGSVVHALVADPQASAEALVNELDALWADMPYESTWFAHNELDRHREMLRTFVQWRQHSRGELTEVGTEVDVDGVISAADGSTPGVRVRGRVDRLERDAEGRLVVVDVKTARSPATKDDAQRHAQLAMYQVAISAGVLPDGDQSGGGRLVYVAKPSAGGSATERSQDPLTPAAAAEWRTAATQAAGATAGPQFVARVNGNCGHCPVRPMCPAHNGERS
ncbi:MAG: ATP-dependent helicase [Mycobacterium sp.]